MRGVAILAGCALAVGVAAAAFWAVTGVLQERITEARAGQAALVAEAGNLRARIAEFRAAGAAGDLPEALLLAGQGRTEAVLGLQERLVALAGGNGVTLTSFAETTAPAGLTHPAVAVLVEGEGTVDAVMAYLAALEGQSPPLGLSQLLLRPAGGEAGRLSLRLSAWGFAGGTGG